MLKTFISNKCSDILCAVGYIIDKFRYTFISVSMQVECLNTYIFAVLSLKLFKGINSFAIMSDLKIETWKSIGPTGVRQSSGKFVDFNVYINTFFKNLYGF